MYDSNPQTHSSVSLSQGSYNSQKDTNKPDVRRNSSSASLAISEELAFIKREVASLKDQVWSRAHVDFLPSEDCSILNSFTDAQPDQSYMEERSLLRNKGDKLNDTSAFLTNQLVTTTTQNAGLAGYASEEKNDYCEVTLGRCPGQNDNEVSLSLDKELLWNGVIVEAGQVSEGESYRVVSMNNEIKDSDQFKRRTAVTEHNPLIIMKSDIDNTSNGLTIINLKPPVLNEDKPSLVRQNSETMKYREMVAVNGYSDEKRKVVFTDLDEQSAAMKEESFNQKKQELARMNDRILEEEEAPEDAQDQSGVNPLLKKTLSVIFSTNESVESTPPQSIIRRSLQELPDEGGLAKLVRQETKDSRFTCERVGNEDRTLEDSYASSRSEEKKSCKDGLMTATTTVMITEGISSLGSEETFGGLLYVAKLQAKNTNSRGLEEKLSRLEDLYNKQVEKYEKTIQMLNEKNEKYVKGNELLVKTLKTCEKEIDSLALNNQTLHKNLLMFEEDMGKKKAKEKQLIESNMAKQKENDRLVEDSRKKESEIEELKKRLGATVNKLETAKVYAKSCEESIYAIDHTLRRIVADKGGPKMSLIVINKVLENIFSETSRFVEKSEKTTTMSAMTCETEAKSPPRRCFTSIGTEDSLSTVDNRERAHSAKKQRSKTPDSNFLAMSPIGKDTKSAKALQESPNDAAGDNRILMQRLIAASGSQHRNGSNNARRSFDQRRASDKDENNVLKPSQVNTIQRRESASTSPCSKAPENKKQPKQYAKMTPELDKIKENLRRKVLRHVSPAPAKR